jgi:ketosteroid isomerase-like protein
MGAKLMKCIAAKPAALWVAATFLAMTLASDVASAGGHKTVIPPPKIDVDPQVEAAVTAVIHDTAERWNSQDFATVLELWDPGEPFPTYLAEEQAQWFVGWDRLRRYLDPPRPNPAIEAIREEMRDIQVKQIAPDLAIAVWYMHFEMKVVGSHPIGENIRVSAVLRNTRAGWRYIHWAESPKTAMVYIEDLFERDVEPGWDEYFERAQQRKREVWRKKREPR